MKVAIVTVAGISSRFNKNISSNEKELKCIYYGENPNNTLLYHLTDKLKYFDYIIIVGGYEYVKLKSYINDYISNDLKEKIITVKNNHYDDFSSGYSLYLGINEIINRFDDVEEVLFVEGDLYIDNESFKKVIDSNKNVLTFNHEPIQSNKSVVLYKNASNKFYYVFDNNHDMLTIKEPFQCILNSGQLWKFKDIEQLRYANEFFKQNYIEDNNLFIIQKYLDLIDDDVELIGIKEWVNCNTRKDYEFIKNNYW